MFKMLKNSFINLLVILLLSACAAQTPMPTPPVQNEQSWEMRQQSLSQLTRWQAEGALSIQTARGTDSMQFNWQLQNQEAYTLRLMGPVGTGYGILKAQPGQSVYFAPQNKVYRGSNPEALLAQVTGWQLPVENLYYWLRGLPAPGSKATLQFDNTHSHLVYLKQDGFEIRFQSYSGVKSVDLPSKLLIENNAIRVKIVITQWQLK